MKQNKPLALSCSIMPRSCMKYSSKWRRLLSSWKSLDFSALYQCDSLRGGKWGKSPGTQVQHALEIGTKGTEFRHFLASECGMVRTSAKSARTFAPLTSIRDKTAYLLQFPVAVTAIPGTAGRLHSYNCFVSTQAWQLSTRTAGPGSSLSCFTSVSVPGTPHCKIPGYLLWVAATDVEEAMAESDPILRQETHGHI